ncbi:TSUP family transporter [Paenibacillus lutrae]|uniref:Probable membrane transporter protein n=1 Tax=Paenibacillus lutrae TaxID=2078573 RepID=A0A7X3K189_9BACL|nr:TSUP family transporter [Paenibacillus lutrae]MVP01988.1 TSUP family transporter [Paenibacillus lutrae]
MEMLSWEMLLFLIVVGFLAAFVDSVVGGGGLITVPALLFTGLPPALVLGTNKLSGTMCSLTSTASFMLSGKINFKLAAGLFPLSLIGSILGALLVHQIPSEFLKPLVVLLLVAVTAYTLLKKNWGAASTYKGLTARSKGWLIAGAFVIGFYDGFFGPGTGSFLIFLFLLLGFDFVGASANSKVLNLASNLGALATFFVLDSVSLTYGLPMGIAMIGGALVGTRFAIRKGASFVKPLFVAMTIILIGKQIWNLWVS